MKNTSILNEPKKWIKLLISSAVGSLSLLTEFASWAKKEKDSNIADDSSFGEAFKNAKKHLLTKDSRKSWKIYSLCTTFATLFFISMFVAYILAGDYILALLALSVIIVSIVSFGYRPWIIHAEKIVPFGYYIKNIYAHPEALNPIQSFFILDKKWPSLTTS